MNVQAFLDNVSFPKNLKELGYYAVRCFDVEALMQSEQADWTVPKWAVHGDIVLFFHAKTAIQQIRRLETELKKNTEINEAERNQLADALKRARQLYNLYGGKIFAIGKVADKPFYDPHPFISEEEEVRQNIKFRTSRRIFAPVEEIQLLSCPIDIAEFSNFIFVSRQSAITPVVGDDFKHLKEIIMAKNDVPDYFREGQAVPMPLQKINAKNWLEVTQQYRRLFTLEIQFRRFYVDHFLHVLGQQKKFLAECRCYRGGTQTGFADNAIKIGGKWCFVEVKLNVHAEPHLNDQLKKYCYVECTNLDNERILDQLHIWQETVLVIDTASFYCYDVSNDCFTLVKELDEIRTEDDIRKLQEKILPMLK